MRATICLLALLIAVPLMGAVNDRGRPELLQKAKDKDDKGEEVITYHKGTKNVYQKFFVVKGKGQGAYLEYHADGKTLAAEGELDKGQKTGVWKWYDTDGKLREESGWVEDKAVGTIKVYKKGVIQYEGAMKDGKRHGPWILYANAENKEAEGEYLEGKKVGKWKEYRDKTWEEGQYVDEVKDGKWVAFDMGGVEIGFTNWARGIQHGMQKSFYPRSGKPMYEGEYVNGRREGKHTRWHATGELESEQNYKNGSDEGEQKFYHPDGKLYREYTSSAGRYVGNYNEYWRDGSPQQVTVYSDKSKALSRKTWAENGQLVYEVDYEAGTEKKWDEKGNLLIDGTKDLRTEYFPGTDKAKAVWEVKGNKCVRTDYYESGAVMGKGQVEWPADKRTDKWEEFHENGNKAAEGKYEKGARVGKWIEYHANGKKAAEGEYAVEAERYDNAAQKMVGPTAIRINKWTFYDDTGKKTNTETYPDPKKK